MNLDNKFLLHIRTKGWYKVVNNWTWASSTSRCVCFCMASWTISFPISLVISVILEKSCNLIRIFIGTCSTLKGIWASYKITRKSTYPKIATTTWANKTIWMPCFIKRRHTFIQYWLSTFSTPKLKWSMKLSKNI